MEDRMIQKKLIIKGGVTIEQTDITNTISKIHDDISIKIQYNRFYRDCYYDDAQKSLLNSDGYLKIRNSGDAFERNKIMIKKKTENPEKRRYTPWDEEEAPIPYAKNLTTKEKFKLLKSSNFDFDKVILDPVLTCSTVRSVYGIYLKGAEYNPIIWVYIDYVTYGNGTNGEQAFEEIIKLRTTNKFDDIVGKITNALLDTFPDKMFLDKSSKCERAKKLLNLTGSN